MNIEYDSHHYLHSTPTFLTLVTFPEEFLHHFTTQYYQQRADRVNHVRSAHFIFGRRFRYDYFIIYLQSSQKRYLFRSLERPCWSPEGAVPLAYKVERSATVPNIARFGIICKRHSSGVSRLIRSPGSQFDS